jgi:hypothetical protein
MPIRTPRVIYSLFSGSPVNDRFHGATDDRRNGASKKGSKRDLGPPFQSVDFTSFRDRLLSVLKPIPFGDFGFGSFGDQVVELLVLDRHEGLDSEVVDDQQIDSHQFGKRPLKSIGDPDGVELYEEPRRGDEQVVVSGPDGAVAEGPGVDDMALPGVARADDQDGDLLFHEPAGGQFRDQGAVDVGVEGRVELLPGLLVLESVRAWDSWWLLLRTVSGKLGATPPDNQGQIHG